MPEILGEHQDNKKYLRITTFDSMKGMDDVHGEVIIRERSKLKEQFEILFPDLVNYIIKGNTQMIIYDTFFTTYLIVFNAQG